MIAAVNRGCRSQASTNSNELRKQALHKFASENSYSNSLICRHVSLDFGMK